MAVTVNSVASHDVFSGKSNKDKIAVQADVSVSGGLTVKVTFRSYRLVTDGQAGQFDEQTADASQSGAVFQELKVNPGGYVTYDASYQDSIATAKVMVN